MSLTMIAKSGATHIWRPTTLRALGHHEAYLEKAVAADPSILGLDPYETGIGATFVCVRQAVLTTPTGRTVKPDLVILTESGHVVIVEAKLVDNPELHDRRVIAQVVDYAASVANLEEEQVAGWLGAQGEESWLNLVTRLFPKAASPDRLARTLLGRIQAAKLHLVIVCDGAPDGLRDVVRAVAGQAALGEFQLHVVELVPHTCDVVDGLLLLPKLHMSTEIIARTAVTVTYKTSEERPGVSVVASSVDDVEQAIAAVKSGKAIRPELSAVLAAYEAMSPDSSMRVLNGKTYRAFIPDGWPTRLHYEFLDGSGGAGQIGVELHLEARDKKVLIAHMKALAGTLQERLPGIQFEPTWCRGLGRLRISLPQDDPRSIAEAMIKLIAATKPAMDVALAGIGSASKVVPADDSPLGA